MWPWQLVDYRTEIEIGNVLCAGSMPQTMHWAMGSWTIECPHIRQHKQWTTGLWSNYETTGLRPDQSSGPHVKPGPSRCSTIKDTPCGILLWHNDFTKPLVDRLLAGLQIWVIYHCTAEIQWMLALLLHSGPVLCISDRLLGWGHADHTW